MKINRTALAAATSTAAVLLAGTAALAANFGILGAGDSLGEISAPTVVTTTVATASADAVTPSTAQPERLAYQVEGVGVVTLERDGDSLDLLSVAADGEWSWTRETSDEDEMTLVFTSGSTVIRFSALLDDGQVRVEVTDETPVATAPSSSGYDVDYDDDHEEHEEHDDDHDDHDDDHEEHDDD